MEKNETGPSLVPEWLSHGPRGSSGAGYSSHPSSIQGRRGERDRPLFDRQYSSNSQTYSNFNRSRYEEHAYSRDRERGLNDRGRDRFGGDERDREIGFRRSISLGARYEAGPSHRWPGPTNGRMPEDAVTSSSNNIRRESSEKRFASQDAEKPLPMAAPTTGSSFTTSIQRAAFDRNFPSLNQERQDNTSWAPQVAPQLSVDTSQGRLGSLAATSLRSPGTGSGEGWSSRLADGPMPVAAGMQQGVGAVSPRQGIAPTSSPSGPQATPAAPKMAEALQQKANQGRLSPQSSVDAQRLEELAVRQSLKLIPMKPSLPHAREKSKSKTNRGSEAAAPASRAEPARSLSGKALVRQRSKELVLPGTTTSSSSTLLSPNAPKRPSIAAAPPLPVANEEKRDKTARNEFFNALRKKAGNASPTGKAGSDNPQATEDKSPRINGSSSAVDNSIANGNRFVNGVAGLKIPENEAATENGVSERKENDKLEEEEAAFLRSLGWTEEGDDENGEGEGLTEEEINAFYRKASQNLQPRPRPPLSIGSATFQTLAASATRPQPKLNVGSIGSVSSGFTSSDSESD